METQSGSSVGGVSGASAESGDTKEVLSMRSSRLECLTAGLVLADLALVTHQLALDASSGESSANKNYTVTARPRWQQGRNQFFTAVLIFSVIFVIESVWRNGRNLMKHRRLLALDAFDCCVCIGSCLVNFGLHFSGANKLLRDLLALLVAARLSRTVQLCRGLSYTEKQRLIQLLNSQHQVEAAGAERLRKLLTELANRDLECQDLRALIKAATLSRHRLKMKQQLQMEKPLPEHRMLSPPPSTPTGRVSQHQQRHHPYDSGHSSDSAPDSPQEPEPAAAIQPDEDQQVMSEAAAAETDKAEVVSEQQQRKPQALKEIN